MSPETYNPLKHGTGVPRASGDEPVDSYGDKVMPGCSPRERG